MSSLNPLQQQAIEALKQQQDAYLAAVRAWKSAAAGSTVDFTAGMPDFGEMPKLEDLPTPEEFAESTQTFYTRLLEEQRRFFESLGDILGRA